MRLIAALYLVLLALMYTPALLGLDGRGWLLYTYWSLVALASVIIAWLTTRGWESWRGSSQA